MPVVVAVVVGFSGGAVTVVEAADDDAADDDDDNDDSDCLPPNSTSIPIDAMFPISLGFVTSNIPIHPFIVNSALWAWNMYVPG